MPEELRIKKGYYPCVVWVGIMGAMVFEHKRVACGVLRRKYYTLPTIKNTWLRGTPYRCPPIAEIPI